jgi:hypothetical protein
MDTPTPVAGRARVTLRLLEIEAIDSADLIEPGEWTLRLWINGLERWRTEQALHLRSGKTHLLGAEVVTEVPEFTDALELEVRAREHDLLSPDDKAVGKVALGRSTGFVVPGGSFDLKGQGAHLRLRTETVVEAM